MAIGEGTDELDFLSDLSDTDSLAGLSGICEGDHEDKDGESWL